MMPYKDGFSLAREIRTKNEEVPLIFLTAKNLKEDVLKGFKIGGAGISEMHANFIVNTSNASSKDILVLVEDFSKIIINVLSVK